MTPETNGLFCRINLYEIWWAHTRQMIVVTAEYMRVRTQTILRTRTFLKIIYCAGHFSAPNHWAVWSICVRARAQWSFKALNTTIQAF